MNRKPKVSWYDECLQVSLLKLAQISVMKHLTLEEVKAYFDEIINDLEQMIELDKKDSTLDEKKTSS